ncbi:MAG: hypothetical protein II998_11755 [Clostridia bacterium]|nr:hypothetical protein [Clostridia bacterium]
MKKLRFDWLMMIVTFVASALSVVILNLVYDVRSNEDIFERVLASVLFFAIPLTVSSVCMLLVETFRKKDYILQITGSRAHSVIAAILVSSLIGGVGQLLYSFDFVTETPPAKVDASSVDVSVMLDYSKGMESYIDKCENAVCDIIDAGDENTNIQFISFAADIFEGTELITITDDIKQEFKDFVKSCDHTGGTNYDIPLTVAESTLSSAGQNDNQAILIVSDGDGEISKDISDKVFDSGIRVYLLSVGNVNSSKIETFVQATGGEVIELDSGRYSAADILNKLKNPSYSIESGDTKFAMGEGLIYNSEDSASWYKFLIRVLVFTLYLLLAGWVMYFSISKAAVISAVISSVIVSLFMLIGSDVITLILCDLMFWTAFTKYYPLNGGAYIVQ